MPLKGSWLLIGAAVVAVSIIAGVLSHKPAERGKTTSMPAARTATTVAAVAAHIQAQHTINVPAPIAGIVEHFYVEVGQEVFEGDLLAQIRSQSLTVSQEEAGSAV